MIPYLVKLSVGAIPGFQFKAKVNPNMKTVDYFESSRDYQASPGEIFQNLSFQLVTKIYCLLKKIVINKK